MSVSESKDSYEEQLHQLFNSCDGEQCGFLDRSQLYELTEKLALDEEQTGYIVDNLICDEFSKINFEEFRDIFVSLLTQSQLFNTSTANYSNNQTPQSPDRIVNLSNTSSTGSELKMNTFHHDTNDEINNRKTNRTTNQSNRRCKKSKKSTNIKFDSSYKENEVDQENKHQNKKNKNKANLNKNKSVNIDNNLTNRKTASLNDRLNSQTKKMRNSSSGTEGYSSLDDDCASGRSAESPDIVVVGLSSVDEKSDHSNETKLHLNSYHLLSNHNKDDHSDQSDELDVQSSDHSTASSTTDLNLKVTNNNNKLLNNSTTTATSDFDQDEIEQSTEQYLGSIFEQLNVGKEGFLTLQELFVVCEHTMGLADEELVKQLFERLDEDNDGKISFDELLKQLTSSSTTGANLTNASGLSCEELEDLEKYQANYTITKSSSTNKLHQLINDSDFLNDTNNENNLNELNCKREEEEEVNQMSTESSDSSNKKSNLSLELSAYSSYKNYFKASHDSSSSNNYSDLPEQIELCEDNIDNVNKLTESYYSLDSNLIINQKSSSSSLDNSKHQRTNSFTTASLDCLKVPSINSSNSNNTQQTTSHYSTLNNNSNNKKNSNQSKSDYNRPCHKRTNSVDNSQSTSSHAHHSQNCNKHIPNTSTNGSSSMNNTTSIESTASFNQTSSNLSSINEQVQHQTGSELNLKKPCDSSVNRCLSSNISTTSTKANSELQKPRLDETSQGDLFNNKRLFSTSNVSTPELEHTQLLSSISSTHSIHQFNSSHLYHHQSSTQEHHLSQQNDEELFTGFGNLLSLDPFSFGYIKVSNLLNLWESLGICNGKLVLEEMGLNSKVNRIQNSEFLTMLEDTLRCSIPFSANRDLFHAVFATIKHEMKYLRQNYDQVKEERDKLRTSIMEANNRADLLAQEVDENHAKLEQSTQNKLLLMEKKYQEQLKYLQDEIQNEREMVNMQMTRLRSDCDQKIQHMQQINMKCKEYCSQLEQENKRLDKELNECTNQLQEADKCNNEIQRELQDAIVIKKKLTELESMQSLLREREYDSLVAKMELTRKENKELQDKNDELQMELEQLRSQLTKQENKCRNRRNNSSEEENDLINYDSQQLNKLFFVAQPIARRPSKDGNLANWQSHCVAQSFYAGN